MINHIRKNRVPAKELTPEEYNTLVQSLKTYYFLIPNKNDEDQYIIYWSQSSRANSGLSSSRNGRISYSDIPFEDIVVMTFPDIREIHVDSKYVLTKNLLSFTKMDLVGATTLRVGGKNDS